MQPEGRRGREFRRDVRERSDRVPKISAEPAAQPLARRRGARTMPQASRQENGCPQGIPKLRPRSGRRRGARVHLSADYRRSTALAQTQTCTGWTVPGGVHRTRTARAVHAIASEAIGCASTKATWCGTHAVTGTGADASTRRPVALTCSIVRLTGRAARSAVRPARSTSCSTTW